MAAGLPFEKASKQPPVKDREDMRAENVWRRKEGQDVNPQGSLMVSRRWHRGDVSAIEASTVQELPDMTDEAEAATVEAPFGGDGK